MAQKQYQESHLQARVEQLFTRRWEDFTKQQPELAQAIEQDETWFQQLQKSWEASDFVFTQCMQQTAWLERQHHGMRFTKPATEQLLEAKLLALLVDCDNEARLKNQLRLFRNREMVALIWRMSNQLAELDEVLTTLTAMADLCVQHALNRLSQWQQDLLGQPVHSNGEPMSLMVIALGKLGGSELNLSSDIDLIFAFPTEGELEQGSREISYGQYFTRLGKSLIAALNEQTEHGIVFRVDMRLRPYGDSGPLVGSFAMLEQYYQRQGREWERYALQKARVITGSDGEQQQLLGLLQPFVYRRYIDFSVLESLREMKALIRREALIHGREENIKVGRGGIREIEFIVQVLQLIHGGRNPKLQSPNLKYGLKALHQHQLLGSKEALFLLQAYVFLRELEHAMQAYADQQTHQLPTDLLMQQRVAKTLSYTDWEQLHNDLLSFRQGVEAAFNRIVALPKLEGEDKREQDADTSLLALWDNGLEHTAATKLLAQHGLGQPDQVATVIMNFVQQMQKRKLSAMAVLRLRRLLPILWLSVAKLEEPVVTLQRIQEILAAVCRRSSYIVLLIENPNALTQLLTLCQASPWFSEQIAKYPLLLDELLDPRSLYAVQTGDEVRIDCEQSLSAVAEGGLEAEMDALRALKQTQILHIAACDVFDKLPLMKVSDRLTELAEVLVAAAVKLAASQIAYKYPRWRQIILGKDFPYAICAYGKLAGYELSYTSDLDLVFLYDANSGVDSEDELPELCMRLSQRVMHILTTDTAVGELYRVDTRLRPAGEAGLLVTSMQSFFKYQKNDAWTWEHQALVRSRLIVGTDAIKRQFDTGRAEVLRVDRNQQALRDEIVAMREKLLQKSNAKDGEFHLKFDRGGITDIEFLVQYWVLLWGKEDDTILEWPDNIRIIESLIACNKLDASTANTLMEHYKMFRYHVHRLSIQNRPPVIANKEVAAAAAMVEGLWQQYLT